MKQLSAQTWTSNWQTGLQNGSQKYKSGVQGYTGPAPGQLAAAQAQTWAQNTANAVQKFAANVGAVSLEQWKSQTLNVGVSKFAAGGQKGAPKVSNFATQIIPQLQSAVNSLPARGNSAQNQARYQAMQQFWGGFQYSKRTL